MPNGHDGKKNVNQLNVLKYFIIIFSPQPEHRLLTTVTLENSARHLQKYVGGQNKMYNFRPLKWNTITKKEKHLTKEK